MRKVSLYELLYRKPAPERQVNILGWILMMWLVYFAIIFTAIVYLYYIDVVTVQHANTMVTNINNEITNPNRCMIASTIAW